MDKENFVKAFTAFAEDDFETSKEILSVEIDKTVNDYLKSNLELENDVIQIRK